MLNVLLEFCTFSFPSTLSNHLSGKGSPPVRRHVIFCTNESERTNSREILLKHKMEVGQT